MQSKHWSIIKFLKLFHWKIFSNLEIRVLVYQKALLRTIHRSYFCLRNNHLSKFTTQEHEFKRWFCTQPPVLNDGFKVFWYTQINLIKQKILHVSLVQFTFLVLFKVQLQLDINISYDNITLMMQKSPFNLKIRLKLFPI